MAASILRRLDDALGEAPLIAILRGVTPEEVVPVGEALHGAGVRVIEVAMNSTRALDGLRRLVDALGMRCVCGAGTVLSAGDVELVGDAGAQFVVAPNLDGNVVRAAQRRNLVPIPGVATPTEMFAAYKTGVRYLKLFPAAACGIGFLGAVRKVLPDDVRVIAVGGVGADDFADWLHSGARGCAVGEGIYRPGLSPVEAAANAKLYLDARARRGCR